MQILFKVTLVMPIVSRSLSGNVVAVHVHVRSRQKFKWAGHGDEMNHAILINTESDLKSNFLSFSIGFFIVVHQTPDFIT